MTAATQDRQAKQLGAIDRIGQGGVAASTHIYAGTAVARNASGYIVPAAKTAGLIVVGVSLEEVDNSSGSAGDLICEYAVGVFAFENDGTNPIALGDTNRIAYVKDDQTVCDEAAGNTVPMGMVSWFDSDNSLVYVLVGDPAFMAAFAILGEETVTSGALSLYTRTSLISVTGTQAYTLGDGLFVGQRKSLRCTVAASTPDGTLTPDNLADGTSLDFDAVEEAYELEWTGTAWRVIYVIGGAITA